MTYGIQIGYKLTLFENVGNYVFKNRRNNDGEKVKCLQDIYEWTSKGDIFDKFVLQSQDYSVFNYGILDVFILIIELILYKDLL